MLCITGILPTSSEMIMSTQLAVFQVNKAILHVHARSYDIRVSFYNKIFLCIFTSES